MYCQCYSNLNEDRVFSFNYDTQRYILRKASFHSYILVNNQWQLLCSIFLWGKERNKRQCSIFHSIFCNVLQWGWRNSQVVCLKMKLSILFYFLNSRSTSNSYQKLAATTPLMDCISLYWFFVVGNIFCSHLNFKKEGRYDCVVGTNSTEPSHTTEIVVLCNPDPCEMTVSSCSYSVLRSALMYVTLTWLFSITWLFSWFTVIAKFILSSIFSTFIELSWLLKAWRNRKIKSSGKLHGYKCRMTMFTSAKLIQVYNALLKKQSLVQCNQYWKQTWY